MIRRLTPFALALLVLAGAPVTPAAATPAGEVVYAVLAMMPEEDIRGCVKHYHVAALGQSVQDFYNGPCAGVDSVTHIDEIATLLGMVIDYNKVEG